jgi:hypothetical protein
MQAIPLPGTGATIVEVYASADSDLDKKTPFDSLPQAVLAAVGWHGYMRVKWDPATPPQQTLTVRMKYDNENIPDEDIVFTLTHTSGKAEDLFYFELPYKHPSIRTMGDHVMTVNYYVRKALQIVRAKDWQAVQIPYKIVPPAQVTD